MKHVLKLTAFFGALILGFSSCDWDDGYTLDKYYISWATVDGSASSFNLVLDDGTILYISANNVIIPGDTDLNGKRVVANYTLLDEVKGENDTKNYYIRLNAMEEVLSKKAVYSSQVNDEEIGNDPINVGDVWFSGKYMNFTFFFYANDPTIKHFINLVVDEDNPKADADNIYVTFRHNAYDDKAINQAFGRVSFDIESFIPEGKESIMVHLSYTNYRGEVRTDSGMFKRGKVEAAPQTNPTTYSNNIE